MGKVLQDVDVLGSFSSADDFVAPFDARVVCNCKSLRRSVLGFARRQEDDKSAPKTRTDDSDHRTRPKQEQVAAGVKRNA